MLLTPKAKPWRFPKRWQASPRAGSGRTSDRVRSWASLPPRRLDILVDIDKYGPRRTTARYGLCRPWFKERGRQCRWLSPRGLSGRLPGDKQPSFQHPCGKLPSEWPTTIRSLSTRPAIGGMRAFCVQFVDNSGRVLDPRTPKEPATSTEAQRCAASEMR